MKTRTLRTTEIAQAAALIKKSKLVAFPTETVYGLGANALDVAAVQKIFHAKMRPHNDPLIVHCNTIEMVHTVATVTAAAEKLARACWPGPLTMVLRKKDCVPNLVTAGTSTVAVRIPSHPIALNLITAAGTPIAAPSANIFTHVSPTTAAHVLHDLGGSIDAVIDGGTTTIGVESTVVDLTTSTPRILRPGGMPFRTLKKILPTIIDHTSTSSRKSPGSHKLHYSPDARVVLVHTFLELQQHMKENTSDYVGILAYREWLPKLQNVTAHIYKWGSRNDAAELANHLYDGLRTLDESCDIIYCPVPRTSGIGAAIVNRLQKATGKRSR